MQKLPWLISAILAAGLLFAVVDRQHKSVDASATPLDDAVDAFVCPSGLTRVALVRGIEDGFAQRTPESSGMSPRLLRNGFYADLADRRNSAPQLRDFDEGGTDRVLVDHFDVPGEVVSGRIVMRTKSAGAGSANDSVLIGDLDTLATPGLLNSERTFSVGIASFDSTATEVSDGSKLIGIPLEQIFVAGRPHNGSFNLLAYLGRRDHPADVDISVGDDTAVDALALLVCTKPSAARGVTFAEHRLKPMGADVSWMGCGIDQSQHSCDPRTGDRVCTAPGPIACYHDGIRTAPASLSAIGVPETAFVGGEVRLSRPVRGNSFAHLTDANQFCVASFGPGWRVLSYHEGGGGGVVSYSHIAPRTRALVNIRDQQYGNCWDREIKR